MRGFTTIGAIAIALLVPAVSAGAAPQFLPGKTGTSFTGKSGTFRWQQGAGGPVFTCKQMSISEGKGELTGTGTSLFIMDFSPCSAIGKQFTTAGDSSGTILMHVEGKLCNINKAKNQVGLVFELLPVPLEWGGFSLEMTGSFIAAIEPVGAKQKEYKLVVQQNEGKQAIEKCEGEAARSVVTHVGAESVPTGIELQAPTISFSVEEELMV